MCTLNDYLTKCKVQYRYVSLILIVNATVKNAERKYNECRVVLLQLFKNIGSLKSLADATPMPMDYVAILTGTDYSSYN